MHTRITVILLLAFSTLNHPATAAYRAYGWTFAAGPRGMFAVQQGSLDSFDAVDLLSQPHDGWIAGTYHLKNQDGWEGDTGFYSRDYRAPLAIGETKEWMVYSWALPGTTPSDLRAQWGVVDGMPLPSNMAARLEYIQKPGGVTGGPDVGTIWTTPPDVILPFYTTTDGLTGHAFKFSLTMVPEPSSFVVFAGGLVGLGGFALRRRNR